MSIWIFLTTHSGLPYELFFLTLSLLFYFFGRTLIFAKQKSAGTVYPATAGPEPAIKRSMSRVSNEGKANGKFRRADIWSISQQIITIIIAFCLFRLIGEFLKSGVAAPRPCWDPAQPSSVHCPDSFSFPSGHALGAFMLAVSLSLIYRNRLLTAIALSTSTSVSISRFMVGVHTLPDIIVGSLLGIIFGFLLWKFYWKNQFKI